MPPWVNYFSQLEAGQDAEDTFKHIRKLFHKLALRLHPDKPDGDGKLFKEALRQKEDFEECLKSGQRYTACKPAGWGGETEEDEDDESASEDDCGYNDSGSDDGDGWNCHVPEPDWHDWASVSRFFAARKLNAPCVADSFRINERKVKRMEAEEAARSKRKRVNGSPPSRQQRRADREESRKDLPCSQRRAAALQDLQLQRAVADATKQHKAADDRDEDLSEWLGCEEPGCLRWRLVSPTTYKLFKDITPLTCSDLPGHTCADNCDACKAGGACECVGATTATA
jgi:curved DNA-binding protein CbpA